MNLIWLAALAGIVLFAVGRITEAFVWSPEARARRVRLLIVRACFRAYHERIWDPDLVRIVNRILRFRSIAVDCTIDLIEESHADWGTAKYGWLRGLAKLTHRQAGNPFRLLSSHLVPALAVDIIDHLLKKVGGNSQKVKGRFSSDEERIQLKKVIVFLGVRHTPLILERLLTGSLDEQKQKPRFDGVDVGTSEIEEPARSALEGLAHFKNDALTEMMRFLETHKSECDTRTFGIWMSYLADVADNRNELGKLLAPSTRTLLNHIGVQSTVRFLRSVGDEAEEALIRTFQIIESETIPSLQSFRNDIAKELERIGAVRVSAGLVYLLSGRKGGFYRLPRHVQKDAIDQLNDRFRSKLVEASTFSAISSALEYPDLLESLDVPTHSYRWLCKFPASNRDAADDQDIVYALVHFSNRFRGVVLSHYHRSAFEAFMRIAGLTGPNSSTVLDEWSTPGKGVFPLNPTEVIRRKWTRLNDSIAEVND